MSPAELLEAALDDRGDSARLAEGVAALLAERRREDERLEYKSGESTRTTKRDADELRRDVCAFASAAGGVVLLGVVEETDPRGGKRAGAIDGVQDDGDRIEDWIEQVLRRLSPHLVPAPRARRVTIGGRDVVVLAIPATERLVGCPEKGGMLAYYLRSGDGRFRVPEYLHADLVLGRKSRPAFGYRARGSWERTRSPHSDCDLIVDLRIELSLANLVWVPRMIVGLVGLSRATYEDGWHRRLDNAVRARLAVREGPQPSAHYRTELGVLWGRAAGLAPYMSRTAKFRIPLGLFEPSTAWRGALVIIPRNGVPSWAQIDFRLPAHRPEKGPDDSEVEWSGELADEAPRARPWRDPTPIAISPLQDDVPAEVFYGSEAMLVGAVGAPARSPAL